MTDAEFFKVHLLRVGSARAIAELERDLIAIQKRLEQEDKLMDEIGNILIDSWSAKDRHLDQFFIMRDCRRIFHERNRRDVQERIKGALEMGPIKGAESIPWDNPDVRLKTLEELFPEFREGGPLEGGDD
jgi:hypothetical protein